MYKDLEQELRLALEKELEMDNENTSVTARKGEDCTSSAPLDEIFSQISRDVGKEITNMKEFPNQNGPEVTAKEPLPEQESSTLQDFPNQELIEKNDNPAYEHMDLVANPKISDEHTSSGSDADNECSDEEKPRALGELQLRQLAEDALEILVPLSAPKSPDSVLEIELPVSAPNSPPLASRQSDTPLHSSYALLNEKVWSPSSTDPTEPNKPKCPPCMRKKKRFDCLGSPPCNECRRRNMTAEQCSSFAPVKPRGKKRAKNDVDEMGNKEGKRGRGK